MLLQTKRVYVRPFTEEDLDDFHSINSDEEIMRYIRQPKSKEESAQFLKEIIEDYRIFPRLGRWGIIERISNNVMGMFSLLPLAHTKDIHIGYALLKKYWVKVMLPKL